MKIILENCHNKNSFNGLEHFRLLLASTDPEVIIAALETLSSLVKITPSKLHASRELVGRGLVDGCLLSLAQGWGSKVEGLGLYSCVTLHQRAHDNGRPSEIQNVSDKLRYCLGPTLSFELHGTGSLSLMESDLQSREEDDLSIMKMCVERYHVPSELRFSLLTRIRYARALYSKETCMLYSKICLLAFIVLVQFSDSYDDLVSFFANEPEYTNELIRIVRSEELVSGTIRTLAMDALGAQLAAAYSASHKRQRTLIESSINTAGGYLMILLSVLHRAILSLNNSSDVSSVALVESLLHFYLLHIISSSSMGGYVSSSDILPKLLFLLEDLDRTHLHLVCLAVRILQKLMYYSNTTVTPRRYLGGEELLARRLHTEVDIVNNILWIKDNSPAIGKYNQKRLIRTLLKALGSATYATKNATRSQKSYYLFLTLALSQIFRNKEKFGSKIYSSSVTLMSKILRKDSTCDSVLYAMGLPNIFLSTVSVMPSSNAIMCIPNGIRAICLNSEGLEAVRQTVLEKTSALHILFDIFGKGKYVMAGTEYIVPLADAVKELLWNVSSLRDCGVDLIIETIHVASLWDTECSGPEGVDEIDSIEIDSLESKDKTTLESCSLIGASDSPSVRNIRNEQCMQLHISRVMELVHKTLGDAETCRLFVGKSGIEDLLKLLLLPSITQPSEVSIKVFECFTEHHSASLARAIYSSLGDHLKGTLEGFKLLSGTFLQEPRGSAHRIVFSSLSRLNILLHLAASMDSRSLLTEFGDGNENVLKHIGCIHRSVLWEIAHTEVDICLNSSAQSQNLHQFGSSKNDDNQRSLYYSCRDLLISLSTHITNLFKELGVVMLPPVDEALSSTSKSVAYIFTVIAEEHISFNDHLDYSDKTKLFYSAKVIDFIDGILLNRPDSCNPLILNYLFYKGVIEKILTIFFLTSRLPIKKIYIGELPETEEADYSWIYGPLASFCTLMEHLVNSSLILCESTKHLLIHPLLSDIPYPRDAKLFVISLQSMVIQALRPLWKNPQICFFSNEIVASAVRIYWYLFCGIKVVGSPTPDESAISNIVGEGSHPEDVQEDDKRAQIYHCVDLEVLIFSEYKGQEKLRCIGYFLDEVKYLGHYITNSETQNMISAYLDGLALILNDEPKAAPKAAYEYGLVKVALDLLSKWSDDSHEHDEVPKWVTSAFVAIDRLAQANSTITADDDKQTRLVEIACGCIKKKLSSETMHVILQFCTTLTKTHSVAVSFLKAEGLSSLLSLPSSSLLGSDKDKDVAAIIHNILKGSSTVSTAAINTTESVDPNFEKVIELLLDSVISFTPPTEDESTGNIDSSSADMEIDVPVKVVFVLRLLTEVLQEYASSVNILVQKDAEVCRYHGFFHHVLCKFLPYSKLASKAIEFLVASCVRSTVARKKIFTGIIDVFNNFVNSSGGFKAPTFDIQACIDLINDVLTAARSPTGLYISPEASVTLMEVGLVKSFTQTLLVLDLDRDDSSKVVIGMLEALKLVTKELNNDFKSINGRRGRSLKPTDLVQPRKDDGASLAQEIDTTDTDQDDHEIDENEFDEEIMENEDEDRSPLVDTEGLHALIRLLRVVQPLYKMEQRLFLNLCAHAETRNRLVEIMMDLLMLDNRKDGVPRLLSRRVLETLTYMARNHPLVANLLVEYRIPQLSLEESPSSEEKRGKHYLEGQQATFTLLLSLLNQPLYLRSIAHLEQLLNLLGVIIDNARRKSNSLDGPGASASEQPADARISAPYSEENILFVATSGESDVTLKTLSSGSDNKQNAERIMKNLPKPELQLLCSLLAREGLSDKAYSLVAEVLRKLVTVVPIHSHLFIFDELADSLQNLIKSATEELRILGDVEKALLIATTTHGAPVLRLLQALSSLVGLLSDKDRKHQITSDKDQNAFVSLVRDINVSLEPLWQELSICITKIESYYERVPDISPSSATQNILPYIESFFVTCEKLHLEGQDFVEEVTSASQQKNPSEIGEKNVAFSRFSMKHRKLLNSFIRQNPGILEKSFSLMLKAPQIIDFDNKRFHFRSLIKHQEDHHHIPLSISVRRGYILEDSYKELMLMRSAHDLKGRLTVHFLGEEEIDAGGYTSEWYQLLSRVIFDKGALLHEGMSYFKFVGRVVGKALLDGHLLHVHLSRSLYKHMLGAEVTYHDTEAIEENKHQCCKPVAEHRLTAANCRQINAFGEGFNEMISSELISVFNDKELELLINGLPEIYLDDLRANTEYSVYSAAAPVIYGFWGVEGFFNL